MKKLFCIFFFSITIIGHAQPLNDDDYSFLNSVLNHLTTVGPNDTIFSVDKTIAFEQQRRFFSKVYLKEYTYPNLTTNSKLVKKLLRRFDLKYLANQPTDVQRLEIDKFNVNIEFYSENKKSKFAGKKTCAFSKPVYTEKKDFAFLYYATNCGYMDCDYTGVRVYRNVKGIWEFYVQFPISMS